LRLPYRILIALIGSVVLAYAGYESARRGLGDWRSMRWRHEISNWAERRESPPQDRLQEAIATLIDALALTPQDPTLLEHLGIAHELRANGSPSGGLSWRLNLVQSLDYFRQSAALRPTSPYTWANILLAKYRLGQVDDEFFGSMRNALDFGPWEPAVQLIVADAALGAWDRLDQSLRGRATENLQRASLRQADALARIASFRRRIDLVCAVAYKQMKNKVKCTE
jgi:hypothetical protein